LAGRHPSLKENHIFPFLNAASNIRPSPVSIVNGAFG
jgi:hypothetical protein